MAAVGRIPLVKLLGISPSGLNASSDGEVRTFYDSIHGRQERVYTDNLTRALQVLQLNEFGEIDEEIGFEFVSLWELDEAGKAAVQKTRADTAAVYIESGVLAPEEERERLASEEENPYAGIDLSGPPPDPPMQQGDPDMTDPSERIVSQGAQGGATGANSGV